MEFGLDFTLMASPPSKLFQQFRFPCVVNRRFLRNALTNTGVQIDEALIPRRFWHVENERSHIFA